MRAHHSTRSGSRNQTGSHFVLAVLLAALVMFGMLAMHGISAAGSAKLQSSTASGPALPGEGGSAPAASPHQAATATMPAAAKAGHAPEPVAVPCANCSTDELSMGASCGAAVVPGPVLPPVDRTPGTSRQMRAGPHVAAGDCLPVPRPSLTLMCINRC